MRRDRVMQRMRRIMAYVRLYAVEGQDVIHKVQLETIFELDMGWSAVRTHQKWTELLVKHGYLSKKNDRVFFITDKDQRENPLESFGGPQVKLETK